LRCRMDIRMPSGRHPHMTEEAMSAVKRAIISGVILLVVNGWARPAQASIPFINLEALGLELCQQSVCGAAIFVGLLKGQVGGNSNAFGTFAVGIKHTNEENPFRTRTAARRSIRVSVLTAPS
jgi:hypothetical protein